MHLRLILDHFVDDLCKIVTLWEVSVRILELLLVQFIRKCYQWQLMNMCIIALN